MPFFGGGGASVANMVGATSSAAGTAGLVPQPAAGDDGRVLNGDATFQSPRYPTKANTVATNRAIGPLNRTTIAASGNYTFYTGRMYLSPIFIPSQLTSWSLVLGVGAIPSANGIVGVYDYGTDTGLPKNRISKSSSFSISNASGTTTFTTAFTDTLKRGIYFLAFSCSTTVSCQGYDESFNHLIGIVSTSGLRKVIYSTYTTFNSDDFPTTIDTSKLVFSSDAPPMLYLTY